MTKRGWDGRSTHALFAVDPNWDDVDREVEELKEAAASGDVLGFLEELGDVWATLAALIYCQRGWALPVWWWGARSAEKYRERHAVWAGLLGAMGLPFDKILLRGGSNWARPEKRRAVLALALTREPTPHEVGVFESVLAVWMATGEFPSVAN